MIDDRYKTIVTSLVPPPKSIPFFRGGGFADGVDDDTLEGRTDGFIVLLGAELG